MRDELLMRFMDGAATPEEVETVIDMLSKDDNAAKEWMQMVQGARLAGKTPAVEIPEAEALERVSYRMKKPARLPWIIGSVAAAAALAIMLTLPFRHDAPGGEGDIVAGLPSADSSAVSAPSDTAGVNEAVPEQMEYMAEAETAVPEEKIATPETAPVVKPSMRSHQDDISTAAGAETAPQFKMLKPSKTPYRVKVKNLDRDFVFEWEAESVSQVELTVVTLQGEVLADESIEGNPGRCPVKAAALVGKGELTWTLKISYTNGVKHAESGKIEFVNMQ